MDRYPEWFIGGPLDGQDKHDLYPDEPDYSHIRYRETYTVEDCADDPELSPDLIGDVKQEWRYTMERLTLGAVVVPFWVDRRLTSRELISTRLGELIMAPHKVTPTQMCKCTDSVYRGRACPVWGDDAARCPINRGTIKYDDTSPVEEGTPQ